jgi:hypothetical protein
MADMPRNWDEKYKGRIKVEIGSSAGFILNARHAKPWL